MRSRHLTRFVLISCAAHAAVIALWPLAEVPLGVANRTLDVRLAGITQTAPEHSIPKSVPRASKPDTPPQPSHDVVPQSDVATPVAGPQQLPPATETTSTASETAFIADEPASDTTTAQSSLALVISYLRDSIERSKVYPLLARQRGWEGEVILAFRIVHDGAINHVTVARSSGHALLDQSAVRALQNVQRIDPDLWNAHDSADLELAVTYRLIKS